MAAVPIYYYATPQSPDSSQFTHLPGAVLRANEPILPVMETLSSIPPPPPPPRKVLKQSSSIPGVTGLQVDTPLLTIKRSLYAWILNNKRKKYGNIFLLGKNKGEKLTSAGILLTADGGCPDSNRLSHNNIINTIVILDSIKVKSTAICIYREMIPNSSSNGGTMMGNVDRFCREYNKLPYVLFTESCQLVWMRNNEVVYRSLLGIK